MNKVVIRKAKRADANSLLALIDALADYEKLKRPDSKARKRIVADAFGKKKRIDIFLALIDEKLVGYAIVFETYSSFLALPTLYLEDIFILPDSRRGGVGMILFQRCVKEAKLRGCGRMEWIVLDWNKIAINFYKKIGAECLKRWLLYRLTENQFDDIIYKH